MDCYTTFSAKISKIKNPIKKVGVNTVYGIDDPKIYNRNGVAFIKERQMTPQKYINQLKGVEKFIFSRIYAGVFAKKLYRLYEYGKI